MKNVNSLKYKERIEANAFNIWHIRLGCQCKIFDLHVVPKGFLSTNAFVMNTLKYVITCCNNTQGGPYLKKVKAKHLDRKSQF